MSTVRISQKPKSARVAPLRRSVLGQHSSNLPHSPPHKIQNFAKRTFCTNTNRPFYLNDGPHWEKKKWNFSKTPNKNTPHIFFVCSQSAKKGFATSSERQKLQQKKQIVSLTVQSKNKWAVEKKPWIAKTPLLRMMTNNIATLSLHDDHTDRFWSTVNRSYASKKPSTGPSVDDFRFSSMNLNQENDSQTLKEVQKLVFPRGEKASTENPPTSSTEGEPTPSSQKVKEYNGPSGKEPTRFGDWERAGRCIDF